MAPIAKLLGITVDLRFVIICWGLIFTRVIIMLILTPFLGSQAVPTRGKIALGFGLSTFLYPLITPSLKGTLTEDNGIVLALLFKEVFLGLAIGLVTVMVFYAFEAAGRIVDHQKGGGAGELFVPQLGQVSETGLFNFWLATAFFLSIGGHRLFLEAFLESFITVPLLQFPHLAPGLSPFLKLFIQLSGNVLIIAVQIATPVVIAAFLVDIVLGIANKMAPQINVFELGFAIRGYVAPLIMYIALLTLVTQMDVALKQMVKSVTDIAHIFSQ